MAGLCWMAVTLVWFLSAGNGLAVEDQNVPQMRDHDGLAGIVNQVLTRYTPRNNVGGGPMFSVAVSIPGNGDTYDVNQVPDSGDNVTKTILRCDVYEGTRVVAATVLKWSDVLEQCPDGQVPWSDVLTKCGQRSMTWADVDRMCPSAVREGRADHAEWRTLQHFNSLVNKRNQNDLMLFYVLSSPCDEKCTSESHPSNILDAIQEISKWENRAFVFSNIFKPRNGQEIPEEKLRGAIERLGNRIGLSNIFRCNRRGNSVQCTSCSTGDQVTEYCYSDQQGGSGGAGGRGGRERRRISFGGMGLFGKRRIPGVRGRRGIWFGGKDFIGRGMTWHGRGKRGASGTKKED